MNAALKQEDQDLSDAELVGLCLKNNHEAFRILVDRYKALLCGLAYSMCGDLGRSEDLAQETFLIAWRKLPELRAPDRVKSWLCAILRNLGANLSRSGAGDPLSSAEVIEEQLTPWTNEEPSELVMGNEEQVLLWKVIQTLPETYREPLILYYRTGESTENLARALEISEEAVRQRLVRGRALLGQQITGVIESGLKRSGPGKAFTVGILAALPLTTASAGIPGVTVGLGSMSIKSTGVFAGLLGSMANVLACGGGFVGLAGHILNTRSEKERRFVATSSIGLVIFTAALFVFVPALLWDVAVVKEKEWTTAISISVIIIAGLTLIDVWGIWIAVRQRDIRAEELNQQSIPIETSRRGYWLSMTGSMAALSFGTCGWLAVLSALHRDIGIASLVLIAAALGAAMGAYRATREPPSRAQVFIMLLWYLAGVNIVTVGFRWNHWAQTGSERLMGLGPVLIIMAVFFFSIRAGWYAKQWLLASQNIAKDVRIVLIAVTGLIGVGLGARAVVSKWETSEIKSVQALLVNVAGDGSAAYQVLNWFDNSSERTLEEIQFVSSEPGREVRVFDSAGRALHVNSGQSNGVTHFRVMLKSPVPGHGSVFTRSAGELPQIMAALDGGQWERRQKHWPSTGVATLRFERYRFPPGTELLTADAPGLRSSKAHDGSLEVSVEKIVPANGSIEFRFLLRRPRLDLL